MSGLLATLLSLTVPTPFRRRLTSASPCAATHQNQRTMTTDQRPERTSENSLAMHTDFWSSGWAHVLPQHAVMMLCTLSGHHAAVITADDNLLAGLDKWTGRT